MKRKKIAVFFLLAITLALLCILYLIFQPTSDLRGWSYRSLDGNTYLVIDADGGRYGAPLAVDGKEWPYKLDERGLIAPGIHSVNGCKFAIPPGHVFHFGYDGP
jgi:hypothetical protein